MGVPLTSLQPRAQKAARSLRCAIMVRARPTISRPTLTRFIGLTRPGRGIAEAGLGLTIAQRMAKRTGAILTLENSVDGGVCANLKFRQ